MRSQRHDALISLLSPWVFASGLSNSKDMSTQKQVKDLVNEVADQKSCRHIDLQSRFLDSLVSRLELLITETKTGHDGLYDEMLKVSTKILLMNVTAQEKPDNFIINYVK